MDSLLYTPILKSKQFEMLALKRLGKLSQALVLPCVDLVAPSKANDLLKSREFVERNIGKLGPRLKGFSTVLLDSSEIDADLRLSNGVHPLSAAGKCLSDEGVIVVPVVGLYRDSAHLAAALETLKADDTSTIALRLDQYDLETPSQTANELSKFVQNHIPDLKIVMIFDCGPIYGKSIDSISQSVIDLENKIDAKHVVLKIVASSSMPSNISDSIPTKSAGYIERREIELFRRVINNFDNGPNACRAIFGDYATVNPTYVELDWALINRTISPKIIYALSDSWFVVRGGSFRSHPDGYDQYYDLASEVRKLPNASAPSFSFADKFIADCAIKADGPSGPGYWAGVGVNRHVAITADLAKNNALI